MTTSHASCPFCQASKIVQRQDEARRWFVACEACGATGPRSDTDTSALSRWVEANQNSQLLRTVLDESPDVILMKDWDGRFLLANATLARLYGTTPDQMVGHDDGAFNPNAEQVAFYLENVRDVMRGGKTQMVHESSTSVETGRVHHYHSIKKPLTGPNGERRILVIAHDMTELYQATERIQERERSYSYAMSAAREGIWDWDLRTNTVTHNRTWCEMLGLDVEQLQHPIGVLETLLHKEDREDVMAALQAALEGDGTYAHEHRMVQGDGTLIWVLDRGQVVERDEEGKPTRMAGSFSNISARKSQEQLLQATRDELARANQVLEHRVAERTAELARANQELQLLARHDTLTGLPNRLAIQERLAIEWERFRRSGQTYAVLLFDVDQFKQINDQHGHDIGDAGLRQVATTLRGRLRACDYVGRYGGEEFIVLLPMTLLDEACSVADELREAVAATHVEGPGHIHVSGGVTVVEPDDTDPHQAIRRADHGLYASKHGGRNRVSRFVGSSTELAPPTPAASTMGGCADRQA